MPRNTDHVAVSLDVAGNSDSDRLTAWLSGVKDAAKRLLPRIDPVMVTKRR